MIAFHELSAKQQRKALRLMSLKPTPYCLVAREHGPVGIRVDFVDSPDELARKLARGWDELDMREAAPDAGGREG